MGFAGFSPNRQQAHQVIIKNNEQEKRQQVWDALSHSIAKDKRHGSKDRPYRCKRQYDDAEDDNSLIHANAAPSLASRYEKI